MKEDLEFGSSSDPLMMEDLHSLMSVSRILNIYERM